MSLNAVPPERRQRLREIVVKERAGMARELGL